MSSGLLLMYKEGLSLVCDQVRHSVYHSDTLKLIWRVVHSVPNSQTTNWPHFPPKPSSAYWNSGWRYMKAVHGAEAWTLIKELWQMINKVLNHASPVKFAPEIYSNVVCSIVPKCFMITSKFKFKQTVSSCRAGMETWGCSLQWSHMEVKSATFPHRLTEGTDRTRQYTVNNWHTAHRRRSAEQLFSTEKSVEQHIRCVSSNLF